MDKEIKRVLEVVSEGDVDIMLGMMEDCGMIFDYLDMPYTDGTYKTEEDKKQNIVEDFMNEVLAVQEFKGESSNGYETRREYIGSSDFEQDYFNSWYECSYHDLDEIKNYCIYIEGVIAMWFYAVECGWIDAEDGWEE